jgi:tetratricopeptide (TPR) repeat protein
MKRFWFVLFILFSAQYIVAQPAYIFIENAHDRIAKKQYAQAITECNSALKKEAENFEAFMLRAKAQLYLNKYDEANKDIEKAIKLNNKYFENYLVRGQLFAALKKTNNALNDYAKVLELNKDNNEAIYLRIPILYSLKKYKEVQEDVKLLQNKNSQNHIIYEYSGNIYFEEKNYEKAIEQFTRAIALNKELAEVFYKRGYCYFEQKKNNNALADFNKAELLGIKKEEIYIKRAELYSEQNNIDKAISDLTILVTNYKTKNATVYVKLGKYATIKNDFGNASKYFSKALTLDPKLTEAYLERGKSYIVQGKNKYQMAIVDFNKVIATDKNNEEANYGLGKIFFETNKFEQAAEHLSVSIAQLPSHNTMYLRSKCFYKLKKNKECCKDLEKAAEMGNIEAQKDLKIICK